MLCAALLGCIGEIAMAVLGHGISGATVHVSMYLCYALVGLVTVLEGKQLLPSDSHRFMLAVSSLLEGLLWIDHATMNEGAVKSSHMFLGELVYVRALVFLYGTL